MQEENELSEFLRNYSFDDVAKSFFVISLWLPNRSSLVKLQYMYLYLEAVHYQLQAENRIEAYSDFRSFTENLFKLIPSFPSIEDYVPEADWGDIKYYFEKRFYKIFYGGDLSNPYDFYYSYELIHRPSTEYYISLIERSPLAEMELCLGLQDEILSNLDQEHTAGEESVYPGHIECPSEEFMENSFRFLDTFSVENCDAGSLSFYTKVLDEPIEILEMNEFVENAFLGRNCPYFFISKGDTIYPVLPRRWFSVLYDSWGRLLENNYSEIAGKLERKKLELLIGIDIGHFIEKRLKEGQVFNFVSPVDADHKPPNELIFTAIHADDRLYLIYTAPPVFDYKATNKHLEGLGSKLKECSDVVRSAPTRIGKHAEKQIVEFRSEHSEALEPVFIIALPTPRSDLGGGIEFPKGINCEVMTLDQLAGLFDEIENTNELNDFVDSITKERELNRIPALSSYLDRFGSFKDSHQVLVPGAVEPDMIMLDFSWGSNYRYKSLNSFWSVFPEAGFFGHPRSWSIPNDRETETGLIIESKTFLGYTYVQNLNKATFFINAPVHKMKMEEGGLTDTLMHSLFDAIGLYSNQLLKLDITKSPNTVQLFFCPSSLVSKAPELSHVRHLLQDQDLWSADGNRMGQNDFGIRVVFNENKVVSALQDTKDRALQVSLLIDLLQEIDGLFPDKNIGELVAELEQEKGKKPRFGMVSIEKRASFPQHVSSLSPDEREYKLADKVIAKAAHALDIEPGSYTADIAKEKLNRLRHEVVKKLDELVSSYDLPSSLPILIEKSNVLIHDVWRHEEEYKATRHHEKTYDVGARSAEEEKEFLRQYRVYRYLIEKFVQHQSFGGKNLTNPNLKVILALTERLVNIYSSSDFINYELFPVGVEIDHDYIVTTKDDGLDILAMERAFGEEQAKLSLGIVGNKGDGVDSNLSFEEYWDILDIAFRKDLGFGLKNLVNVQQVLARWADFADTSENTYYTANVAEIKYVCTKAIKEYDEEETDSIVGFLTLKPDKLLHVKERLTEEGSHEIQVDLPVWEHNKRLTRLDIRPLIKIDEQYYWGPHSIERAGRVWLGICSKHRLPSDIDAPTVKEILSDGHKEIEKNIESKACEIVSRFTTNIEPNLFLHKIDDAVRDIGDCDVLAYLPEKNILLNIETKIIDAPYSNKDSGRVQRKIYGEKRSDGKLKKGYIQRVEERDQYLEDNALNTMAKLGWNGNGSKPEIVSIFVTQIGFWWTTNPPMQTDVNFVEVRMLEDFIMTVNKSV